MTDKSAMVIRMVPALFIVPIMAISPSSTLRELTIPSMGAVMKLLLMVFSELFRAALVSSIL